MPDINIKADVKQTSTLGKVKVMVEQVVGQPSQEDINTAVAEYISSHPGSLAPLSPAVKAALLQIAEKVAYVDENGQDYYDALDAALNAVALLQITAVFTQGSAVIYDTDNLDSLKQYLVVTAYYDDGTTADVTSASVLSGTLEGGESTVTVIFNGKTASFTVTVTGTVHIPDGTHSFSDGSTVTVSNNHVTAYLATYSKWRFINLSAMSDNGTSVFEPTNVNAKSTEFLSLSAGDKLTLQVFNGNANNTSWGSAGTTYNIAVNMRKQNDSTSIFADPPTIYPAQATTPSQSRTTEAEVTQTMGESVVASNVFLYIAQRYPARTTFECDIRIIKE